MVIGHSLLNETDIYLFRTGKHIRLYEKLGSKLMSLNGHEGVFFAVYAPMAKLVEVIGDFNQWKGEDYRLYPRWDGSGIWEGFIPNVKEGDLYKYKIHSHIHDQVLEKIDPFARYFEIPPNTASIVWDTQYEWKDKDWMAKRKEHNGYHKPYSVYEVHLGSWMYAEDGETQLSYLELADKLVAYVKEMEFTHVEFLPVMEHPYEPSWGYQVTGFFAPTSRFGKPQDFKVLVDRFHQEGIGVLLDWVPSHFPADGHALGNFDGSHLYEHPDWKKGYHPDWDSLIFNYERDEIRSFLLSSAIFWLDEYHADGLRVDAVASIIHLDYSREEGQWEPNRYGGNGYLDGIKFIKDLNEAVYREYPDTEVIAEESTDFPKVSWPLHEGGLGFGQKWMMGWMHDTLKYFKNDPLFRKHDHGILSFSLVYAFSENFMLPFSHDEVVHGKSSMIGKMPGDEWHSFANLRALYGYMYTHPGSQLLFMGGEIGQYEEWNDKAQLSWQILGYKPHKGLQTLVKDLNILSKTYPALYERAYVPSGFSWIDNKDVDRSIITYMRHGEQEKDDLLVVCNFVPVKREKYRIGVPPSTKWKEIFNSDDEKYWGNGTTNKKPIKVEAVNMHGKDSSISVDLPALGVCIFAKVATRKKAAAKSVTKNTLASATKKQPTVRKKKTSK